ncbi:hypothetical protein FPV67DRAFT_674739 [Lyophyllum atratum]|nr:hypothetical protein FPV67DRAFT_674739 [Lyophyllum atratum]
MQSRVRRLRMVAMHALLASCRGVAAANLFQRTMARLCGAWTIGCRLRSSQHVSRLFTLSAVPILYRDKEDFRRDQLGRATHST